MHASLLASNRVHLEHAIAKVLASGKRRVGMIGLAFKSGTDDLRESPLVLLAEHLIGKGFSLLIYDADVQLSRLLGANRRFIEQHVPHIGSLLRSDIAEVISASDLLIVGLDDAKALAALRKHVRQDQLVLDLVSMPRQPMMAARVAGLCW
jgi:GDP-mannose 6-dehydrogenase